MPQRIACRPKNPAVTERRRPTFFPVKFHTWLASSLQRQFPLGPVGRTQTLRLLAARGERVSFQACARLVGGEPVRLAARVIAPAGVTAWVRRVGGVPVAHHSTETPATELDGRGFIPGFVPDVLWPETEVLAAPGETVTFWITLRVPRESPPQTGKVVVELVPAGGAPLRLSASLEISPVALPERRDFRMTHWFYADALCDWYKVAPWSAEFWPICRRYLENYVAHGNDTLYVPVFTPPLDGVKRPTQLLRVQRTGRDRYRFDWTDVRRWVRLAREVGVEYFEWTHLFTQWGAAHAIRVYEPRGGELVPLWPADTGATSPTYRRFLEQFLPELHRFLQREKLLERSFFHLSDEPHGDEHLANYRAARALLAELAPWMKIMDALSDIRFAREGLTDLPVPVLNTARDFAAEGIPAWCYFCCVPRGKFLNRLLDTPLAKVRMSGWLFRRFAARGFLHWGYNYWYRRGSATLVDPFLVTDAQAWPIWPHGDAFMVYPGPDGPLDSVRWEVFAESLQDYALLEAQGVMPDAALLADLRGYDDFPWSERWIAAARRRLLRAPRRSTRR